MKREDFYNSIPNAEGVDKVLIERAWKLLVKIMQIEEKIEQEDDVLEEDGRDGIRTKANPFWSLYLSLLDKFQKLLSEMGLTPKARKTLAIKEAAANGLPQLPKRPQ